MINQMNQNDHTPNAFSNTLKELQIGKLLRKSNITKSCGISAYEVFQFLLLSVFQGKNLFRFLNSKHKDQAVSKNTYCRFLNETSYNWSRFLLLLAVRVTAAFDSLTRPERVKVLILDDSVIKRNRSKTVELPARVYDHVEHKFQKGFTLLALGRSDGYGFIPTGFNLLSSATKSNRYNEVSDKIDHRTNGYKFRKESMMQKTDAAILLIICGNRRSIKCFFKASKSFLKLGTGFQSHNYGAMVSHTAIVFTRYIILEWIRRNQNDQKTYGELFYMFCEDIQDMDLTNALQSLMALFVEHISTLSADITSVLKSKVTEWIASQAAFIQALFGNICRES
ncbi:MAG: hypothetical protein K2P59_08690 [Acetatifactor sp.]|nr:hypothetical protein [Acetatifactor sp.]